MFLLGGGGGGETAQAAVFSNTFSKKSISPFGSPEGIQMALSVIAQNKEDRFFKKGLVFSNTEGNYQGKKRLNSAVVPKELVTPLPCPQGKKSRLKNVLLVLRLI